jgi:hypothetical protein
MGDGRDRQRAKFFDDARGSAIECAACLDASVAKTELDSRAISKLELETGEYYAENHH